MPRKLSHNGLVTLRLARCEPKELYSGLLSIARDKGYKNGWVAHKFREIYGKWPRPVAVVQPAAPISDLVEWLGFTQRRWRAKKKRSEMKSHFLNSVGKVYDSEPMENHGRQGQEIKTQR